MGQPAENVNSDFYGKSTLGTFEVLMIPQGNLIWGMSSLGNNFNERMYEHKESSSTGMHQGFTLFKK
jgi:hypothetical protein